MLCCLAPVSHTSGQNEDHRETRRMLESDPPHDPSAPRAPDAELTCVQRGSHRP
jgi:hypothetical protein